MGDVYVDDATTWGVRRALYAELLGKPDTVLLLAEDGAGAAVGYGLAHVMAREETWVDDTWVAGPHIGEIESLSVLPAHRGAGIGTALLDRLELALAEQGVA
jgi:ribosomal protein S18 acetylase RimI-like enzyme